MKYVVLFIAVVLILSIGCFVWGKKKSPSSPIVSLVALLRKPMGIDQTVLAKTAGKVWQADLGDGISEGKDGFVVGTDPSYVISCRGIVYLINAFKAPYVADVEATATSIVDMRPRELFRQHKAWFSCDAMGLKDDAPPDVRRTSYKELAKLFEEFLNEDCLLIYIPETGQAYPVTEEARRALHSDDPLAALRESTNMPVISVPEDDPGLQAAVKKARETWPRFIEAFEKSAGSGFAVKAPVNHGDRTEFIWISVTAIEGKRIYGVLANDPANLGPLKLGSKVQVALADLNDWCYIDPKDKLQGAFTQQAVQEAARRQLAP